MNFLEALAKGILPLLMVMLSGCNPTASETVIFCKDRCAPHKAIAYTPGGGGCQCQIPPEAK
jgi:hypothetical protein